MSGSCADPEGGTPLKNQKNLGVSSNTGLDPLKMAATKPAFNFGPSSARQRNHHLMAFCRRADDGTLIVVLGSSLPSSTKRKKGTGSIGNFILMDDQSYLECVPLVNLDKATDL